MLQCFQYYATKPNLVPEFVQSGIIRSVLLLDVVIFQRVALQWPCVPFPIHPILGEDHCRTQPRDFKQMLWRIILTRASEEQQRRLYLGKKQEISKRI